MSERRCSTPRSTSRPSSRGSSGGEPSSASSAGASADSADDAEREAALDEDSVCMRGPPLTTAQRHAATIKLRLFAAELLHNAGRPLPSKLARQLKGQRRRTAGQQRELAAHKSIYVAHTHAAGLLSRCSVQAHLAPDSLLRVMHHFSVLDGSCPDALPAALPPPPPSAPPRAPRPPKVLTEHDRAVLKEDMIYHTWRVIAKQMEGDWNNIFEVRNARAREKESARRVD